MTVEMVHAGAGYGSYKKQFEDLRKLEGLIAELKDSLEELAGAEQELAGAQKTYRECLADMEKVSKKIEKHWKLIEERKR